MPGSPFAFIGLYTDLAGNPLFIRCLTRMPFTACNWPYLRAAYQAENEAVLDARVLQSLSEMLKVCLEGVENDGRGASSMIHKVTQLLMIAYTRKPMISQAISMKYVKMK